MIGTVFAGRYELTGLVSEGAIFTQYSAKDKLTGREVSLRFLKPPYSKEEPLRAALEEAVRKAGGINSPNVERLLDVQDEDDQVFLVGDLTRAPSLADRIKKLAPFTSPVAVAAAIGVCRGLDAFHKAGLVHGDVSGENVAMMADGETRLQLGGIWEAYSASPTAGAVVLPAMAPYLAPEVSSGGMPSRRSDVYAVGVLLFELLTGRKPYLAERAVATVMRHASEPTPRIRSLNPAVPIVLDEIVYKAMSKDPTQRYAQASELMVDLRQVQDAQRFGKVLSWPLRQQEPVPKAAPAQPVVVETRRQPQPKTRPDPSDRDVPVWMLVLGAVAASAMVTAILIYMVLNVSRPNLVTVPNMTGLTSSEARATLTRLHLKFREGPTISSERLDADHVAGTDPPAGEKVDEGSVVNVSISSGSKEVEVPMLKGFTPDKAREVLATENLTLDDQMDQVNDPSVPAGTICKQTPEAKSKVDREQKVHVAINQPTAANADSKPPPTSTPPPSTTNTYVYKVSMTLDTIQTTTSVRIDVTDLDGTRTIYDQDGNPGDLVEAETEARGSEAEFTVYFDGQQVKKFKQKATETNQ